MPYWVLLGQTEVMCVKLSDCHTLSECSVNVVYIGLPDSAQVLGMQWAKLFLWSRGQQVVMAHGPDQSWVCFLSKALHWNYSHPYPTPTSVHLFSVYGCCPATGAELSSWNKPRELTLYRYCVSLWTRFPARRR